MIIKHLRRNGMQIAVGLAAAGLMVSGPVQALAIEQDAMVVDAPANDGLQSVAEVVADLIDPPTLPVEERFQHIADGEASYYGRELAGNRTASGERFNPQALTAAHRTLPMGTRVRVTNKANGMSVIVRINDRGPFVRGRILDISLAAARQIQMIGTGKAMVRIEQLV
jgi:rare lipoprotein A